MGLKKIGIIGFNIFASGGTSRSNLNLINELTTEKQQIVCFNQEPFNELDVTRLRIEENLADANISFYNIEDLQLKLGIDCYIITRESLFICAKKIRFAFPSVSIVGEVHGPLSLVDPSIDLSLSRLY